MADTPFARTESGRYATEGLSSKEFSRVFDQIDKDRRRSRRTARRTLNPLTLKNKALDDIIALGKKKSGMFYTKDDLKGFEKNRAGARQQFNSAVPGITYAQLVAGSQQIDIKRANNRVDDGSGIRRAVPTTLKHNVLTVSVEASAISVDKHHRVKFRFEEWDQLIEEISDDEKNAAKIAKRLCAGRVSFDCDCGRHQYWYRYIATAGNFALAPPKEYAYPKEKNPNLKGVACKHVIHAFTRLQSASWQVRIGQAMRKSAGNNAYSDDPRKTTEHFTDADKAKFNRNRSSQTNVAAVQREHEKYQRRMSAVARRLDKDDGRIESLRGQLTRAKKMTAVQRSRAAKKQAELADEKAKNALLRQQLADQAKIQRQTFIDALVLSGTPRAQAEKMFTEYAKKQTKTGKQ
ncbi:phage tail protein [Enterobacter sp. BRE11]|nr:phage tail protein [Enterobacter sp. BRE11]